jgi:hypothetical protein
MKRVLQIMILFLVSSCSNQEIREKVQRDTLIFGDNFPKHSFMEVFGNLALTDRNGKSISSLYEDSSYFVKATPGYQNLKFILIPLSKNLTIEPIKNNFNEFIVKTKKLNSDSLSEMAIINFGFDTSYNKPIIIRRDFSNSTYVDNYLDWDGLGTMEYKIKKKVVY